MHGGGEGAAMPARAVTGPSGSDASDAVVQARAEVAVARVRKEKAAGLSAASEQGLAEAEKALAEAIKGAGRVME